VTESVSRGKFCHSHGPDGDGVFEPFDPEARFVCAGVDKISPHRYSLPFGAAMLFGSGVTAEALPLFEADLN
jgi:hypothetical protein